MTLRLLLPLPLTIALLVLLALIPALILPGLRIDNAPEVYFPPDAPAMVLEGQIRQDFPQDQVLVGLFQGDGLFEDDFILALEDLERRLSRHPQVERVLTPASVEQIRGFEDGFVVETLLGFEAVRDLTVPQRRNRVLGDRFAPGLLVSEDGQVMAVVVRPRTLAGSLQRLEMVETFQAAVREAGIAPQLAGMTGNVALDVAELKSMIRDNLVFIPAVSGIGLLLIGWLFRRWLAVIISAVTLTVVVGLSVSFLVLAGRPYTLVATIIPPLMSALTVALLIHLFNALVLAARRGWQGRERVLRALEEVERPARYTALTTAAGFASLGVSPIPPINGFGLAAAAGMLVLYPVVVLLVPPLLVRWDRGTWSAARQGGRWLDRTVSALARLAVRRAGWVLGITVLVLVVGLPWIGQVRVESDLYEFFPPDHPLSRTTRLAEDALSGVMALEVVLEGPGRDALKDPVRLERIARLRDWLESQPQVGRAVSMADIVEEMHWGFHGEDPAYRRLPQDPALVSQYLFVYDGTDLYDLVDREFQRTLIPLTLQVRGANDIEAVIDRIRAHLEQADLGDLDWQIGGIGRLFADQEDLLIAGQVNSLWAVLLIIGGFMVVVWRSFKDALLCMIPNLSPILLIFIVMGAFGFWLDMATALVASVAVGIAVDDTIHIFHKYRRLRRQGLAVHRALARSYRQVGRAIVLTTVILSAQFMLLCLSQFRPTAQFGLLTTFGLVAALLFDLLVLPAILVLSRKYQNN